MILTGHGSIIYPEYMQPLQNGEVIVRHKKYEEHEDI